MAWDLDDSGKIKLSPLVDYQLAILAKTFCGVRLALAQLGDQHGTSSQSVQVAMTVRQAMELAQDLQQAANNILALRPEGPPS